MRRKVVLPSLSSRTSPRLCRWAYSLLECRMKSRLREMTSTGFSPPFRRSQDTERWLCWSLSVDTSQLSSSGSCSTLCRVWGTAVVCRESGITVTQKVPTEEGYKAIESETHFPRGKGPTLHRNHYYCLNKSSPNNLFEATDNPERHINLNTLFFYGSQDNIFGTDTCLVF